MFGHARVILKEPRMGDYVNYKGQRALVWARAGDQVHLKFTDGSMVFVSMEEVVEEQNLSTMKSCPFCKKKAMPILKESQYDRHDEIYQCMDCNTRFSDNKKGGV